MVKPRCSTYHWANRSGSGDAIAVCSIPLTIIGDCSARQIVFLSGRLSVQLVRVGMANYIKSPYLALLAAFASPGLAAAQSIAPDEMHARTVPYAPPSAVTLR